MKWSKGILVLSVVVAMAGCADSRSECFSDPTIEHGVQLFAPKVVRNKVVVLDTLWTTRKHDAPLWHLCQWNFRNPLEDATPETSEYGTTYRNGSIVFARNRKGVITLCVDAGKEYDAPRTSDGSWPNLLIETKFENLGLGGRKSMDLSFDIRLLYCENLMGEALDESLHTAQTPFYLLLRNRNKESEDYGVNLWLGVLGFDYRFTSPSSEPYFSWDKGTSTYIYQIPGQIVWKDDGTFTDGKWHKAEADVLKAVEDALAYLKENGLYKDSRTEDFSIEEMNFGWETPGTFRCGIQIRNISLKTS